MIINYILLIEVNIHSILVLFFVFIVPNINILSVYSFLGKVFFIFALKFKNFE